MSRRRYLHVSAALMATYIGYVVWAKLARLLGPPPVQLGEVGEFLLFFAAIVAFTGQVVADERVKASSGAPENPS